MATLLPAYAATDATTKQGLKLNNMLYLIQDHCCHFGYYWDDSLNECVEKIKNCYFCEPFRKRWL